MQEAVYRFQSNRGESCIFQQDDTKPHTAAVPAAQRHTGGNIRLDVPSNSKRAIILKMGHLFSLNI